MAVAFGNFLPLPMLYKPPLLRQQNEDPHAGWKVVWIGDREVQATGLLMRLGLHYHVFFGEAVLGITEEVRKAPEGPIAVDAIHELSWHLQMWYVQGMLPSHIFGGRAVFSAVTPVPRTQVTIGACGPRRRVMSPFPREMQH